MKGDEARAEVKKRLRREVPDDVWDYVVDEGFVAELLDEYNDAYTIEDLVRRVERILTLGSSGIRGVGRPAGAGAEISKVLAAAARSEALLEKRATVLSKLLAEEASRDPEVIRYRDDHLGGKTIPVRDIGRWIDKRYRIEMASKKPGFDPRTEMIRLAYMGEWHPWDPRAPEDFDPDGEPEPDPGSYVVPTGGPLEQLVRLSHRLSDTYSWQEADATTFVVTGRIPSYFTVAVRRFRKVDNPSVASRITVELDLALTPQQLARMWIYLRKAMIGRPRLLSPKHMELAEFVSESSGTWERLWRGWNENYPQYGYRLQANFVRDAKRAKRNLLTIPFKAANS